MIMSYLAVPISASNPDKAAEQIKAALAAGAEILELRTDYLENLSAQMVRELVAAARAAGSKAVPLIVTCRDKNQGGSIGYPLKLRLDVLVAALKAGAEFIDFELDNFLRIENQERILVALSQSRRGRLILSAHNFSGKFDDILGLHRRILSICPSAIPKLVYTADHINDCFGALDLLNRTGGERIALCMGEAGVITRILAKKFGGFVTFASLAEQCATAPGQLTISELKDLYRYDAINAETELFGVIAEPVAHSLSPAIHNAGFASLGMNRLYLPLLVQAGSAGFDSFMRNIIRRRWLNFRGLSVTIPHKHNALAFARSAGAKIEPLAEKIGAVNTLVLSAQGGIRAYNTDYAAALDAITSAMGIARSDLKDLNVAVIGAGGVSRAIVAGLNDFGARIKIYNRTVEKAQKLAEDFGCEYAGLDELDKLDARLIVNCTSVGMYPNVDESPLLEGCLNGEMTVFDTVYNPAETLLLRQAKKARARVIDGVTMFVNQAIAQFRLFTGQEADAELARKTVMNCLS